MQSFELVRPADLSGAIASARAERSSYIAGGTDLMQLMKDNLVAPTRLVDLEGLLDSQITSGDRVLRIGALATMADVAAHPDVVKRYPVISQALLASAAPQLRNMATIGGNLLQRTRCSYFRDTGFNCNKRIEGSGCPAIRGENRNLAVLGVSDQCIATNASDLAVALVALDAVLELQGTGGEMRHVALTEFHREPGSSPHLETVLRPGEVIAAIEVPAIPLTERSAYLKVRDRASFEFALVSAAVAMDVQDGTIRDARIAMGGVGTKPWRAPQAEAALRGLKASPETFQHAAQLAVEGAKPASQNAFKITLAQRAVVRALTGLA